MREFSLRAVLLAVVWLVSTDFAFAHHVLGRPSYQLGEDSNTPSALQAEVQIGDFMVTYMVFPAFPQPNAPGRISLYIKRYDNDEAFSGTVAFKIRDDVIWPGLQDTNEEFIGTQGLDDNNVFRQSFQFSTAGTYLVSAEFSADGEAHVVDFPLRVGDVSPVSPLALAGGAVVLVLLVVSVTQRRRAMTGKVRGNHDGQTGPS